MSRTKIFLLLISLLILVKAITPSVLSYYRLRWMIDRCDLVLLISLILISILTVFYVFNNKLPKFFNITGVLLINIPYIFTYIYHISSWNRVISYVVLPLEILVFTLFAYSLSRTEEELHSLDYQDKFKKLAVTTFIVGLPFIFAIMTTFWIHFFRIYEIEGIMLVYGFLISSIFALIYRGNKLLSHKFFYYIGIAVGSSIVESICVAAMFALQGVAWDLTPFLIIIMKLVTSTIIAAILFVINAIQSHRVKVNTETFPNVN